MKSDYEFKKVVLDDGKECLEDKPLHDTTMVVRRAIKPAVAQAKAKAEAKKLKTGSKDLFASEPVNPEALKPKTPSGIN